MTLIKPAQSVIDSNRRAQTGVARYRFPEDLGAHAMVFNFKTYQYRGGEPVNTIISSSVALPIPTNINESFNVSVGSRELGIVGAAAADISSMMKTGSGFIDATSELMRTGIDEARNVANSTTLASSAAGMARWLARAGLTQLPGGSEVEQGISSGSGVAINPHASIVFDGVSLRTHSFDWMLSPKSSNESGLVRDIVNEFRKAALPSYASPLGNTTATGTSYDRALLNYPSMVDIFFVGLDQEYYFYFKTCMINNISVDYTPQGQALFAGEGGARPVMINFKIDLTEAQIHTKEDYSGTGASTGNTLPTIPNRG